MFGGMGVGSVEVGMGLGDGLEATTAGGMSMGGIIPGMGMGLGMGTTGMRYVEPNLDGMLSLI